MLVVREHKPRKHKRLASITYKPKLSRGEQKESCGFTLVNENIPGKSCRLQDMSFMLYRERGANRCERLKEMEKFIRILETQHKIAIACTKAVRFPSALSCGGRAAETSSSTTIGANWEANNFHKGKKNSQMQGKCPVNRRKMQ